MQSSDDFGIVTTFTKTFVPGEHFCHLLREIRMKQCLLQMPWLLLSRYSYKMNWGGKGISIKKAWISFVVLDMVHCSVFLFQI